MVVAPSMTWLLVRISPEERQHDAGSCGLFLLVAERRVDVHQAGVHLAARWTRRRQVPTNRSRTNRSRTSPSPTEIRSRRSPNEPKPDEPGAERVVPERVGSRRTEPLTTGRCPRRAQTRGSSNCSSRPRGRYRRPQRARRRRPHRSARPCAGGRRLGAGLRAVAACPSRYPGLVGGAPGPDPEAIPVGGCRPRRRGRRSRTAPLRAERMPGAPMGGVCSGCAGRLGHLRRLGHLHRFRNLGADRREWDTRSRCRHAGNRKGRRVLARERPLRSAARILRPSSCLLRPRPPSWGGCHEGIETYRSVCQVKERYEKDKC